MKQDMILILDLGSDENTVLARMIRDLGVYSEIKPHDITEEELAKLDNIKRKLTDSFNDFSRAAMGEGYTEGEILEPAEG